MEYDNQKTNKNRLIVSKLITDVLSNKKTVSEALSLFPKDKNDVDLKCAFDALVHREADEDLRKKIADYSLMQDSYLNDIAKFLKENQRLPKNIVNQYLKYHPDNILGENPKDIKNIIKGIKRIINF